MTPFWERRTVTFASSAGGRHEGKEVTGRILRSISSSLIRRDTCSWSRLGIYGLAGPGLIHAQRAH